jgi:hypothetical protein
MRTILQAIVGGILFELSTQLTEDVGQPWADYIPILYMMVVALAQIGLEALTGRDIGIAKTSESTSKIAK